MSKHILVVDDAFAIRQIVGYTLRSAGYRVSEAADGMEAFEKACADVFDLVLTDLHMPRVDGLTLIARLRAQPRYRFTPMLVLSTESSVEAKSRGRAAGATGWLVKPFEPRRLLELTDRVLGR